MRSIKGAICCIIMMGISLQSFGQTIIKLRRQGNVYILPCKVNGLLLEMFFDTGADDVCLSLKEANYMLENGYLKESDIVGKESYKVANGDIAEGTKIIIRKITFAGLEINDVAATVMPHTDAPLLFGQSAIGKLGKIQIDPENSTLTIFKGKGTYDFSKDGGADKDEVAIEARTKDARRKEDPKPSTPSYKSGAVVTLTQTMRLRIDRQGGANGASIAWHPGYKRYYAAMAGNIGFPMEIFDANGRMVSPDDLETMFDVRGLWYNPATKSLQTNGYNDFGWSEYVLDGNGIPVSIRRLNVPASQPSNQSVGTYDTKNNLLYFYDMEKISIEPHSIKNGEVYDAIPLHLGMKTMDDRSEIDQDELKYYYNENAIVYTGISQSEIGLLNVTNRQIELYNLDNGLMTKVLKLPSDAPVQSSLNFSYCNGVFWLFDKDDRVWHGYK